MEDDARNSATPSPSSRRLIRRRDAPPLSSSSLPPLFISAGGMTERVLSSRVMARAPIVLSLAITGHEVGGT